MPLISKRIESTRRFAHDQHRGVCLVLIALIALSTTGWAIPVQSTRSTDQPAGEDSLFRRLVDTLTYQLTYALEPHLSDISSLAPGDRLTAALGGVLVASKVTARFHAALILGEMRSPLSRLVLWEASTRESDSEVFRAIQRSLIPGHVVKPEEAAVTGRDPLGPGQVVSLLKEVGETKPVEALPFLLSLARQGGKHTKDLVKCIAKIGDPRVVPELEKLANLVEDAGESWTIQSAIVHLRGDDLRKLRRDKGEVFEEFLAGLVGRLSFDYDFDMAEMPFGDDPQIRMRVIDKVIVHGKADARIAVLESIHRIKDPVAPLVALEAIGRDPDERVQAVAHRALVGMALPGVEKDEIKALSKPISVAGFSTLMKDLLEKEVTYASPVLTRLLKAWPLYRPAIVSTLGKLGDREAMAELKAFRLEPSVVRDNDLFRMISISIDKIQHRRLRFSRKEPETNKAQLPKSVDTNDAVASIEKRSEPQSLMGPGFTGESGTSVRGSVGQPNPIVQMGPVAASFKHTLSKVRARLNKNSGTDAAPDPIFTDESGTESGGGSGRMRSLSTESRAFDQLAGAVLARASLRDDAKKRSTSLESDATPASRSIVTVSSDRKEARDQKRVASKSSTSIRKGSVGKLGLSDNDDLPPPNGHETSAPTASTRMELGHRSVPEVDATRETQRSAARPKLNMLSQQLASEITRPSRTTFTELARRQDARIVIQMLDEILLNGHLSARVHAARVLAESRRPSATLILLDHYRRHGDLPTMRAIVQGLQVWRGEYMDLKSAMENPVEESRFLMMLEDVGREKRQDLVPFLTRMLESWPEYTIPLIRTLALVGHDSAIPDIRGMVGFSPRVDAEALGALALLGLNYELNRDRLSRALPRATELGEDGLQAFESILFYLGRCFVEKKDPKALKAIFFVPPYGDEPFSTQAMGILSKSSRADPRGFVDALALIPSSDQDLFVKDFVAFLYQKELSVETESSFKQAWKNLDLGYQNYDVMMKVMREIRDWKH